ncbi:hypothetical protein BpHYR1_034017 [Brachionus plicatilis]|uniref:Uncharacterized protein n=1 Tax=Brachionus plicatilis TaxID=10195 RepID=A0A3M7P2A1_BRAPC|nr:hypothetical protein BpHYR1_034017 [Brachionus plicatilis]
MSKTYTHQDCEKTTPSVFDTKESENKIRFVLSELVFKILLNMYKTYTMVFNCFWVYWMKMGV